MAGTVFEFAVWRILPMALFAIVAFAAVPTLAQPPTEESFGLGSGVRTGGGIGGYIDTAIVRNQVRFRFDAAYGNNKPDRAEYFYAKCGCFRVLGADPDAPGPAPSSGPQLLETIVDYQLLQADLELMLTDNVSVILAAPVRLLNPTINDNTAGMSDLQAGLRLAAYYDDVQALTFQLRTYIPTGDADRGLGTNHVSLEPGVLFAHKLTERLTLESELKDWIPIGGSSNAGTGFTGPFAGNVISYGLGLGFDLIDDREYRVTPVVEAVGWTILDGLSSSSTDGTLATANIEKVDGDTIVNMKFGARISKSSMGSIYAGYGTALTTEAWYSDIMRLEYRVGF